MEQAIYGEETKEQLLEAQAHIWNHVFYFLKSMALKCAIQLGIPDIIHKHGKPMTLKELANSLPILPTKHSSLSRLMRLLVSSKFFTMKTLLPSNERGFALTLSSQLLLKDHPLSQAPFALTTLSLLAEPSNHLSSWFQNEVEFESPFQIAHGKSFWEHICHDPMFNKYFNLAMESDSRFVTSLLVTDIQFKGLLQGVGSLVDVGGGNGTTAKAISEAYPSLLCHVLELPHVVEGLHGNDNSNVVYVAGDMFTKVPRADAVLLKSILHDWSDIDCIKILKQCKEAIHSRSQGGKVIIIDMVVDPQIDNSKHSDAHILFDIEMMSLFGEGKERSEQEWKKLFVKAGFGDYKILPILGLRSVIVLYPTE